MHALLYCQQQRVLDGHGDEVHVIYVQHLL